MFDGIKTEILLSMVRHALTLAGGLLVSKGWLTADGVEQIIGAILTLAAVGWGAAAKVTAKTEVDKALTTAAVTGTVPAGTNSPQAPSPNLMSQPSTGVGTRPPVDPGSKFDPFKNS